MSVVEIGLIRHFKVNMPKIKKILSSAEFAEWTKGYEGSNVIVPEGNLCLGGWTKCFCSSSPRAKQTADSVFAGKIIDRPNLCEVPLAPLFKTDLRLPFVFWLVCGRLAWILAHNSQPETYPDTLKRVEAFTEELLSGGEPRVLVVSHGFILKLISKELKRRGFKGERIIKPQNGKLYTFTKA